MQRADDARRHGLLQPEWSPDRDDVVADLNLARVGERQGEDLRGGCIHLQDGHVGRRVSADDVRGVGLPVPELDGDRLRAVHDMLVREDVTLAVVDEPGPLCLRTAEQIRSARDGDLHHALAGERVDRVHGETARVRGRLRVGDSDLPDNGLRVARGERGVGGRAAAGADASAG